MDSARNLSVILVILSFVISGCSPDETPLHAGKYQVTPVTNPVQKESEEQVKDYRQFEELYKTADLVLSTFDWRDFEETKPVHDFANRQTLGKLLQNKKLPGNGVALVQYGPVLTQNFVPTEKDFADVRQALKDAGFVRIYFFPTSLNLQ